MEIDKINEAIDNFYKLKMVYEKDFYEIYVREIVKSNVSKKEKKRLFQKLPKPKCINCLRNVGTIFSIKQNEDMTSRIYKAYCGDISDPCPLNIQIDVGNIELYSNILSTYNLNKIKKDIIMAKNDLLFGYVKEEDAFKKFETLTSTLTSETATYDYYLEEFLSLFDNIEYKNNLQKKQVELGIDIQEFKEMIKEAKMQNNTQIINNAVEFYVRTLLPLLKEIEVMKYPINKMEINDGEYHLIQQKNTIENTYVELDASKLVSFVTGTKEQQPKTTKSKSKPKNTTVKTEKKREPKNKTKKNPVFEVLAPEQITTEPQEQPEEEQQEEEQPEEEQQEEEQPEE